MRMPFRPAGRGLFPFAAALAFFFGTVATGSALHYIPGQESNGFCYDCHTLDADEGDPGTSFINANSRTLPWMKIFNGGSAPAELACTYCHNNPANGRMREALSHFGAVTSKHPVGVSFTGIDSYNEYFSSWSSAVDNELDCVDCHDVSLGPGPGYPEHGAPPPGNPYLLRGVTTPGEYDDLCRICHGAAAAPIKGGNDVRVTSHGDGEGTPLLEADGTVLRAADRDGDGAQDSNLGDLCTACHDTHYSNNQRLFNDGHEGDTAISGGDCTSVCHYAGDENDSYLTHGHGKAESTYKYSGGTIDQGGGNNLTMEMACTTCHVSLDPASKPHREDPVSGSDQVRYKARFNLNINLQGWDDGSVFGNPLYGVCYQCHSTYDTHQGAGAGIEVGCIDCHDEHAEGSGDNVFMIPEMSKGEGSYIAPGRTKGGVEEVFYDSTMLLGSGAPDIGNEDFYRGDDAGVCDNGECHGAAGYTPLSSWMSGGSHSGGDQAAGSDCGGCHPHNGNPSGGFRAEGFSCNSCHGVPPTVASPFDAQSNPDGESYPGGAGAHQRHIDALGPAFDCSLCHGPAAGNTSAAAWHNEGEGTVTAGNVDVIGHGDYWDTGNRAGHRAIYVGTASAEDPSAVDGAVRWEPVAKGGGDRRCGNLTCHGDPPISTGALNWTDDMVNESTGLPATEFDICRWCHDGTPSSIDAGATWAPNMMGNGTFGAETSGHGLASGNYDGESVGDGSGPPAAGLDCYICHDATYTGGAATRTHFGPEADPRDGARLRDTINGAAIGTGSTFPTGPDETCIACHQSGSDSDGSDLSHHGNDGGGGYTPLEGSFLRSCRQCHEVHGRNWNGSGRNLHMIGNWIDDDGDGIPDAGEGARVDSDATDENTDITIADNAVVFTSFTGNDSFNDGAGSPEDELCETCHGPATGGGDHGGTPGFGSDERGNDCTGCHGHDYDGDYGTPDAFMPSALALAACETCHGGDDIVHPGLDGVMGTDDDAPHVMRFWTGSKPGVQDGGHGDPDGAPAVECRGCHDINTPAGTHFDGTVNSVWHNGYTSYPRNENTAHLKDVFIYGSPVGDHRIQTTFDDACYTTCHQGLNITDMRHSVSNPVPNAVQFGRKLTTADGDDINNTGDGASGVDTAQSLSLADSDYWPIENHPDWPPSNPASQSWPRDNGPPRSWPVDKDISTNAIGGTDYGTCVSCHDPHGSAKFEPDKSNRSIMMREHWISPADLCTACH